MLDALHDIGLAQEDAPPRAASGGAVVEGVSGLGKTRRNMLAYAEQFLRDAVQNADFFAEYDRERAAAYKAVDDELAQQFPAKAIINETTAFKKARRRMRRRASVEARTRVCERHGLKRPPKSRWNGLRTPTGAGKTSASTDALVVGALGHSVDFYVPTHEKADELQRELVAAGREALIERGYSADDPDWEARDIRAEEVDQPYYDRRRMCLQAEAVEIAANSGVEIGKQFCSSCPFVGRCGYHIQRDELQAARDRKAVIIKTHARLSYNSSVGQADIAILDEDPSRNRIGTVRADVRHITAKYFRWLCGPDGNLYAGEIGLAADSLLKAVRSGLPSSVIDGMSIDCFKLVAKLLRQSWRQGRPNLGGERDPEKIAEIVQQSTDEARHIAKILDQVARSAEKQLPCDYINIQGSQIACRYVKSFGMKARASCLFMSANLRTDRLSATVRRRVKIQSFEVDRNIIVDHVRTKSSTAALTGLDPTGKPYSGKSVEKATHHRDMIVEAARDRVGADARALFAANSKVQAAFLDQIPETWTDRHFGELEGLNSFSDYDAIVLAGQSWPPLEEIERIAAAVALEKGKAITTMRQWMEQHPGTKTTADGLVLLANGGEWHPDPFVEDEIEALVGDAYDQAIGRLRAVNSPTPKKVVIFRQVLPGGLQAVLPVDDLAGADNANAAEIYLHRCLKRGLIPITSVAAKRLEPGLFRTAKAAKEVLRRSGLIGDTFHYSIRDEVSKGDVPPFRYRIYWRFPGRGGSRQIAIAKSEVTEADLAALFDCEVVGFQCQAINQEGDQDQAPAEDSRAYEVTLVTSLDGNRPAAKRFRKSSAGFVEVRSKKPYWIAAERQTIGSVDAMFRLLKEIEADPYKAAVRGELLPSADTSHMRRKIRGKVRTLRDAPRSWCMLDVDDFQLPAGIEVNGQEDLAFAVGTLLRAMPPPFKNASCIVQLSNSMGIKAPPGIVKAHLWFQLKSSMTGQQLKEALQSVMEENPDSPSFDLATANAAQLLATAKPECQGFDDPLPKRLFRATAKNGTDVVDLPVPKPKPQQVHQVDELAHRKADRLFELALEEIGGGLGFHRSIGRAAFQAARAIEAGKFTIDHAVTRLQAAVYTADPGHRDNETIEDRANPEGLRRWIAWHLENTSRGAVAWPTWTGAAVR